MSMDKMENTLDSIRPSDYASLQDEMSFLVARDPSILAYGQRPLPSDASRKNLISLYEDEELDSRADSSTGTSISLASQTVKVYLRMKPFPRKMKVAKEAEEAYTIINPTTLVTKLPSLDTNTSALKRPKGSETVCRKFTFTKTFGPDTTQLQLFDEAIKQQMVEFVAGQSATVMSYGTTNAGKSYTLQGTTSSPGIIPRGLEFVFSNINPRPTPCYKPVFQNGVMSLDAGERAREMETKTKLLTFGSIDKHQCINAYKSMQRLLQEESPLRPGQCLDANYSVWVSFAEIYNETIFDLLSNDCQKKRTPLKLATDNRGRAFIKGLKMVCVNSGAEAYQVLMAGQYNLKVAATALNARSSRSHCIFTIKLLKYYKEYTPEEVEVSTFSFCDLAGSERLKKTLNVGDRLKEAQNINTSLLVLGRCLKSIWEGQSVKLKHEITGPFRESKLTRLFQRALSGKEHIAMIVNVNPVPNLYVETQNVLNFSAIAKKIVIEPTVVNRKTSTSRFSQIVSQSVKTVTDWDTSELDSIAESCLDSAERTDYIHPEDYDELMTENEKLKREIAKLKASALNRDLEIRQEMSITYGTMMRNLEASWKSRIKDAEEQQDDMLTWSVNQVENYYKEKLSELNSRKRRRSSSDDGSDGEEANIEELEIENTHLTAKVNTLKGINKDLRENNHVLSTEKNKAIFELSLVKEELKNMKKLLNAAQQDIQCDQEAAAYIEELKTQLTAREDRIKSLKQFLNEAKEEYIAITSDAREMEERLKDQKAALLENAEKIVYLEELFDHANGLLEEKTKALENLEEKVEVQNQRLMDAEEKAQNAEDKLSKSEAKKLILLEEVERLQKMILEVAVKDEEKEFKIAEDRLINSNQDCTQKCDDETLKDLKEKHCKATDAVEELQKRLTSKEEHISLMESKLINAIFENTALNDKLSQSSTETKLLKADLDLTKVQLDHITKQIEDLKLAESMKVETCNANNQTSFVVDDVETVMEENQTRSELDSADNKDEPGVVITVDSSDQTTESPRKEQVNQTSFLEIKTEEKNSQTSFIVDGEHNDNEEQLQLLQLEYSNLKTEHENKILLVKELTHELEDAKQIMKSAQEASNVSELKLTEYKNSFELIEKELQLVIKEKEELQKELSQVIDAKEILEIKVSNCQQKIDQLESGLKDSQDQERNHSASLEEYIDKVASLESQLFEANSLIKTTTMKCSSEHESVIDKLQKEVAAARERDDIKTQCMDAHSERIFKLERDLAEANKLENKVIEFEKALEERQKEKEELQRQMDENNERMSCLQTQLQEVTDREQEKDNEISYLQKEVKNMIQTNARGEQLDDKMEKDHKETLRELTAVKESLCISEEALKNLEKKSKQEIEQLEMLLKTHEQKATYMGLLQQGAESRQAENDRLRLMNDQLKKKLVEKDREMEAFSRNRDETIIRYEGLVKSLQEDVERNKREVTRFQELFVLRQTPTPSKEDIRKLKDELRTKTSLLEQAQEKLKKGDAKQDKENFANTSDDDVVVNEVRSTRRRAKREPPSTPVPPSDDIAIIELSGSESKRTTRRTALPPPAPFPSSEKRRPTRKKKLFAQTDEGCVDVEPCESTPRPQPSPLTATHNLRNRRR